MPNDQKQKDHEGDARQKRAHLLRETRRSLIVTAARDVFAKDGLEGASMRSIAREAGCTTGAIYPYFHGKEELYHAVLQTALIKLHEDVITAIERCEVAEKRASSAVLAFYDFYHARPDDLALGLYLFNGLKPTGLGHDLDKVLNRQLGEVVSLIEKSDEQTVGDKAMEWTASAIAHCMGLLVMGHTGRLSRWRFEGRYLLEQFLQ
ncbi:putative HTH-type transcriptional regulator TtgW [Pseudovibrio axinellae]|uniref:Putative HTH-type transcriptional regulator TtgW n=1 Tax=Pseudovibrio axinellae TaxID=989403 RepID=A0A165SZE4_9HYPH|nr:TetR/AcrR family transcriptional regulator [Pseudovibrio axinellae]KZL05085.1 putative HTH-type transcriptional regulator TtgW [Pseudovibrio axinellae]SER47817.1 transcriptional regulator, TetR family [Pseudovibrio axinellae]